MDEYKDEKVDGDSVEVNYEDLEAGEASQSQAARLPFLPNPDRTGDLMYDGHEMTKEPGSGLEESESVSDNDGHDENEVQQPETAGVSTASLTPSLRAAAPLSGLRPSRRLNSLPGAFRMNRGAAVSPDDDPEVEEDPSQESESVGFFTHNAHEVFIPEAFLVSDRSLAPEEVPPPTPRESVNDLSTSQPELVVEAKAVRTSCLCDMLGNWKAICFIILVIIAIAGVAAVIERYRPIPSGNQQPEANAEIVQIDGTDTLQPSLWSDNFPTVAPTSLPLASMEQWTTLENAELVPTNLPTTSPAAPQSFGLRPTTSPSSAPTSFEEFLPAFTQVALADPQSPQSLALDWIYRDPHFDKHDTSRLVQRYTLAVIYFSLDGPNWARNDGWLSNGTVNEHECSWYSSLASEAVCNSDGTYQTLLMHDNQLKGTIPPEMWLMSSLVNLAIFENRINGTFPETIGEKNQIEYLTLKDLSLTGTLPTAIGRMRKIRSLELSTNALQGSLPTEIAFMTNLRTIYLDRNQFTGSIPSELAMLTQLESMILDTNLLSGSLPTEFSKLTGLEELHLSNNRLEGQLSTGIFAVALQYLEVYGNLFSGNIPTAIGLCSNAKVIDLADNLFSGTIPSQLGQLDHLSALLLHNNALTGSIPTEVCELKQKQPELLISVDCDAVSCDCGCDCSLSIGTSLTATSKSGAP